MHIYQDIQCSYAHLIKTFSVAYLSVTSCIFGGSREKERERVNMLEHLQKLVEVAAFLGTSVCDGEAGIN